MLKNQTFNQNSIPKRRRSLATDFKIVGARFRRPLDFFLSVHYTVVDGKNKSFLGKSRKFSFLSFQKRNAFLFFFVKETFSPKNSARSFLAVVKANPEN